MKIKRMDEKPLVVFDDITPGTVFEYKSIIYMKMPAVVSHFNVVRLCDGACSKFIGDEELIPLNAELVIK